MFDVKQITTSDLEACVNELMFRMADSIDIILGDSKKSNSVSISFNRYYDKEVRIIHRVSIGDTALNGGSVSTMLQGALAAHNLTQSCPEIVRALAAPPVQPQIEAEDATFTEVDDSDVTF